MKIRFFIFFCFANSLLACEPDNRAFAESTLRTMERYHGIPVNEFAISGDFPDSVLGETDRHLSSYMVTLNRSIMKDRQLILQALAHEVGHAKDHSQAKFMQAIVTYYACIAAAPNVLAYATSKLLSIKGSSRSALHSVCTAAGIASAVFFHEEAANVITRNLEKRADLIGLDYLVAHQEFKTICHHIAYLERAQYQQYDQGPHRPSSQEEFRYTKKFLKDHGILLDSELKEEKHQRLNGQITLRKDNQKIFSLGWQWKPKC